MSKFFLIPICSVLGMYLIFLISFYWEHREKKGGETMDGYKRLSFKEEDLVWDRERFDRMPEQERELLLDEIEKIIRDKTADPEACDLYDKCRECPNFKDCFGIQAISFEVGARS